MNLRWPLALVSFVVAIVAFLPFAPFRLQDALHLKLAAWMLWGCPLWLALAVTAFVRLRWRSWPILIAAPLGLYPLFMLILLAVGCGLTGNCP